MADIFGNTLTDYDQVSNLTAAEALQALRERNQSIPAFRHDAVTADHNFDALGSRKQAYAATTPNLAAVQAQVDRVVHRESTLADLLPIATNFSTTAGSAVAYPVTETEGGVDWISDTADNIPIVSTSLRYINHRVHALGAAAAYTAEQMRNAVMAGIPLETELIDESVRLCNAFMQEHALLGVTGQTDLFPGLLTQRTRASVTADHPERVISVDVGADLRTADPESAADAVIDFVTAMKRDSAGLIGNAIGGECIVGLPPSRMERVSSRFVGDRDITIKAHVERDNAYNFARAGNTTRVVELLELENAGPLGAPMMCAWVNDPRVVVYANPVPPRVKDEVRSYFASGIPIESIAAPAVFVKVPLGVRYGTGI